MASNVVTSTYYLDHNDTFLEEKPYELKFQPPEGFPAKNTTWSEYKHIQVRDIREQQEQFTVEQNGFQICHLSTSLTAADFDDQRLVEVRYLKEVAHCMKDVLQADRVLVFDYKVKRC